MSWSVSRVYSDITEVCSPPRHLPGVITEKELKETINDVMKGTGEAMGESEFEEMLDEFDEDGDGIITFDEFKRIMHLS